ncbi:RHS repeat-associated core domain-containing protein [Ectopseudomonas khazarica]|uniref:RHS repeat-associated core domain-containing protein n=1 Tax=Ectopseudomonas khazarica TaxID=2502979 RepID=UPI004033191F
MYLACFHTDHLGTPLRLTGERGQTLWQGEPDDWTAIGQEQGETDQPIRFQGQYHDEESGLYYNRYRYYAAELGRYVTQDPIGLKGGLNTYGYVKGNPVNLIDPTGEEAVIEGGYSGGWFAGLGGVTASLTAGMSSDGTFCGTQFFIKGQVNPMLGAGYWMGIGRTYGAGYNDGPLTPGFSSGTSYHVEGAGSGGVPVTGGFAVDAGLDGNSFSGGRAYGGGGEGIFLGQGLSKSGTLSTPCLCGER